MPVLIFQTVQNKLLVINNNIFYNYCINEVSEVFYWILYSKVDYILNVCEYDICTE